MSISRSCLQSGQCVDLCVNHMSTHSAWYSWPQGRIRIRSSVSYSPKQIEHSSSELSVVSNLVSKFSSEATSVIGISVAGWGITGEGSSLFSSIVIDVVKEGNWLSWLGVGELQQEDPLDDSRLHSFPTLAIPMNEWWC